MVKINPSEEGLHIEEIDSSGYQDIGLAPMPI